MQLKDFDKIENNPLQLVDLPIPEIESNEIRVKVNYCGVCRTDLHTVEDELENPNLPIVPGHQVVGEVDKAGKDVSRFQNGDRVGIAWLHETCGECKYCKRDKENLCENAKFTGYDVNGGYAEYAKVPAEFAYSIPEGFPGIQAPPLLCAGIVGYRALKLSELKPGNTFGIYGFGASAHVIIQIAVDWDCEVFVFTRSKEHQELAKELGAEWIGTAQDTPPKKVDNSVIFAPAGDLVPEALRVLEKGGTLSLAGIHMSDIPKLNYRKHLFFEKTVRSVTASTREDGRELLKLANEIPIKTRVQDFDLQEANKALQMVKHSEINGSGVLKI